MAVGIPTEQVRERLNEDDQFRRAAKYWHAQLLLRFGAEGYVLDIGDGVIRRFEAGANQFDRYTGVLGGSEEDWARLLSPVPPPFYQDFFSAFFRHQFEIAGDLDALFAHSWALLRFRDIMRDVTGGKLGTALEN